MNTTIRLLGLTLLFSSAALPLCHADPAPIVPDIAPFVGWSGEARVDLNGDGSLDSYYGAASNADRTSNCDFGLYDLKKKNLKWSAHFPSTCIGWGAAPIWHYRSFMGDSTRDFTIVVQVPPGPGNNLGYALYAGDGATGQLRDFALTMGNAANPGALRWKGIQTIDFQLPDYPGPALLVRNTGGQNQQRGYLIYFPSGSNQAIDLTANPLVIDAASLRGYPFPGIDIASAGVNGNILSDMTYTSIYNGFNAFNGVPAACIVPLSTETQPPWRCDLADGHPEDSTWNAGNGAFLDQIAVGDIDGDRVEDAVMTYLWRSVVYPGRPKGRVDLLGAPQYDNYYNPQNDGSACHSGRHYGMSALVHTDSSPLLKTVNLAGNPVGSFADPFQTVSRNLAVIDTQPDPTLPTFIRPLLWNRPMNTTIPGCNMTELYQNALHIPADGMLRDGAGLVKYLHVNRWTQLTPVGNTCEHGDSACHDRVRSTMTGYWSWEIFDTRQMGATVKSLSNMYVWDVLPATPPNSVWLLYSSNASVWDLQTTDPTSATAPLLYRDDLKISLLNMSTLEMTETQNLPLTATPTLKVSFWQQITGSIISSAHPSRLWTAPVSGSSVPGFLLNTPTGFSFFALKKSTWSEKARYNAAGDLIKLVRANSPVAADYDSDRKSDLAVWRPDNGHWHVKTSPSSPTDAFDIPWGLSTDIPVEGDYDGDGKSDLVVWRPVEGNSVGTWYIKTSATSFNGFQTVSWGLPTDIPVGGGDYDGDGVTDIVVWRPVEGNSVGTWYIKTSSTRFAQFLTFQWGLPTDIPIGGGDYDGDGVTDIVVWRPSDATWYILTSYSNFTESRVIPWGLSTDIPIGGGDYFGSGKTDIAVWRPSDLKWYILTAASDYTQYETFKWGLETDIPVVGGDYDGDGRTDIVMWRPSGGNWFVLTSASNFTQFQTYQLGLPTDIPLVSMTAASEPGGNSQSTGSGLPNLDLSGINDKTYTLHDTISLTYNPPTSGYNWEFIAKGSGAPGVGTAGHAGSAATATTAPRFNLATLPLRPGPYTLRVQAVSGSRTSAWASASITLAGEDLAGVVVSPNPWRADRHGPHPITFDNLPAPSTIKIFTVSGHWVTTLPAGSASVTWNLLDDSGRKVASGLYLYLLTTPDGQKKSGQLAVIR